MSVMRVWHLLLLAACCSLAARSQQAQPSTPPAPAAQASSMLPGKASGEYAETDICKTCHEEVWEKHFAGTPHSALLKGDQHGCQGCHGPAQAHVDGGGDTTKIIRFEKLTPAQTAAICLNCHQANVTTQSSVCVFTSMKFRSFELCGS